MKKRIIALLAMMVLSLLLCVPALAAGFDEAGLYFVTDEAGLLSDQEWLELETRAEEISREYKCGVYIILLDDFYPAFPGDIRNPSLGSPAHMAAGMEIVILPGDRRHPAKIVQQHIGSEGPGPRVGGAQIHGISSMGHQGAESPLL